MSTESPTWKRHLQQHRSLAPAAGVSDHITRTVSGCSSTSFPALLHCLPCLFENRNIWLYKLLLEIFHFLINTHAFMSAVYNTATTIGFKQLLFFFLNQSDCNPLAVRKQLTLRFSIRTRCFRSHDRSNDLNDFWQPVLLLESISKRLYLWLSLQLCYKVSMPEPQSSIKRCSDSLTTEEN